jgi:hypothetical protein
VLGRVCVPISVEPLLAHREQEPRVEEQGVAECVQNQGKFVSRGWERRCRAFTQGGTDQLVRGTGGPGQRSWSLE